MTTQTADLSKVFSSASQLEAVKQAQSEIANNQTKILEKATGINVDYMLQEATRLGYTPDTITNITTEELVDMFRGVEMDMAEDATVQQMLDFQRGIVEYFVRTTAVEAELALELERLDVLMKESAVELDALSASFGDIDAMMETYVHEALENATGAEKEHIQKIVDGMNQAQTFDDIYTSLQTYGWKNIHSELALRPELTLRRCLKNCTLLEKSNPQKISEYGEMEARLFGVDSPYAATPNLFLFTVLRHLAFVKNPTREREGVFIAKLLINLKHLYAGTMPEARKERFSAGVKRILDLYV